MKLGYQEEKKYEKLNIAAEIICALILGAACFYLFLSMFGLKWGTGTMFGGSLGGGISGVWDQIAEKLGTVDYIILPRYEADTAADGTMRYGLSLTFLLAVLSAVAFLIIRSGSRLFLMFVTIPPLFAVLILKLTPSAASGTAFMAALLIVLAVMNIKGKIRPEQFTMLICALLIGAGAVYALEKTVTLTEPRGMAERGTAIWAAVDRMRYGEDPLPHGDIGKLTGKDLKERRGGIGDIKESLRSTEKADDEALSVKMSDPESFYLRGFIGADYAKNRWKQLPNGTFYGMRDTVFWLNRRSFDGLSEMSEAAALGGADNREIQIDVEVKDASKDIAFTPYELKLRSAEGEKARKSEMVLPKGTKNYGGSFLGLEGLTGKQSYSYSASGNVTGIWTDAVGKLFTAPETPYIKEYFINESHYNVLQYEHYTDVPDDLSNTFVSEIGLPGDISSKHADYKETIQKITEYLKSRYIYSENFGAPGKGKDLIQSFVDKKLGSDIHFASLATMLFRYFGIPARYVEGYLITPDNVMGAMGEKEISVSRKANHAWTEIYIDGFGWIPYEATPEYAGIMREADLTIGLQNVDYEDKEDEDLNTREDEPPKDQEEDSDALGKLLLLLLKIIAISALSAILLYILYRIIRAVITAVRWRKAFSDKEPKTGIKALYQYSAEKKWKLSNEGENIGLTASYSTAQMEESDRTKMRAEVEKAKERAQGSVKKDKGKGNKDEKKK